MRSTKTVCCILCTVFLISLLAGCGQSNSVKRFPIPSEDFILSNMNKDNGDVSLVLRHDGTYAAYTDGMYDNFLLLQNELLLRKDYFENNKIENRGLAATATSPHYGDNPPGTVPDYKEYEGVSYEEYLKQKYEDLEYMGFRDKFDEKTNKLKVRPAERLQISLWYSSTDGDNRMLDNKQLAQYYIKAFEMLRDDPKSGKFLLKSVNLECYKTGAEAQEIRILISEDSPNKIIITLDVISVRGDDEDNYYKFVELTLPQ